jgi:hypothetical protein
MTAVPPVETFVPSPGTAGAAPVTFRFVESRHAQYVRFFAALWTANGVAIIAAWLVSVRIGVPPLHPNEYPGELGIYVLWAACSSIAIYLSARVHSIVLHSAAAVVCSYAVLFTHKSIFCALQRCCYGECVRLIFSGQAWELYWILLGSFIYATTVAGSRALHAIAAIRAHSLRIAEAEQQTAAENIRAASERINAASFDRLLDGIAERIVSDARAAEAMIIATAESLRRQLRELAANVASPAEPFRGFEKRSLVNIHPLLVVTPPAFVFGFIFELAAVWMRTEYYPPDVLQRTAVHVAVWLLPLPLALALTNRLLRRDAGVRDAALLVTICALSGIAAQFLWGLIAYPLRWYDYGDRVYFLFDSPVLSAIRLATRRLESAMAVTIAALLGAWMLQLRREHHDTELQHARADARLTDARLQLLRSQLNPHFLFNALNSVLALLRHDAERACDMVRRLSRFNRIVADTAGRQLIALEEEIEFARQYLAIQKTRFGDRLSIEIRVPDSIGRANCPALLLQPLVENAVKHGVGRTAGPGFVRVDVAHSDQLRIVITNNGRPSAMGSGVGLANSRQRLHHLYGDAASLMMRCSDDQTTVEVSLPYKRFEES